jgi:hypothetical protein
MVYKNWGDLQNILSFERRAIAHPPPRYFTLVVPMYKGIIKSCDRRGEP